MSFSVPHSSRSLQEGATRPRGKPQCPPPTRVSAQDIWGLFGGGSRNCLPFPRQGSHSLCEDAAGKARSRSPSLWPRGRSDRVSQHEGLRLLTVRMQGQT